MQAVKLPVLVEKENILSSSFKKDLQVNQEPNIRKKILEAVSLGNAYRTKVNIIFRDDDGLKKVNTTIWAFGDRFICLKGGMWIPISRIVDVIS